MYLRRRSKDRGASMLEYGAVILVVASIVVAVFGFKVPGKVTGLFAAGMDRIENPVAADGEPSSAPQSGEGPGGPDGPADREMEYWSQSGPGDADDPTVTYGPAPPPGHPAGFPEEPYSGPDPDDADPKAVEDAHGELEECAADWDESVPWFTGSCAWEVFKDLSPEEFAATVEKLSDEELRRLFETGPVPLDQEYFAFLDEVQRTASLDTLRTLTRSGAEAFADLEPDISEVGGDGASGTTPGELTYGELDDYTVFADGDEPVKWEHVDQQALGDCWLMATMGAMAAQSPEAVQDMIQENANGTFTVTFPGKDPIHVTPDFPLNSKGDLAFAGAEGDPPVLWPAILEKAYAQKEGGDYSRIENWHPGAAMDTFGGDTTDYIPDFTGISMDDLADKFEDGEAITLSTPPKIQMKDLPKEGTGKGDLVDDKDDTLASGHVYFVTGVDRESEEVTIRNPWGAEHPDIVLSIDDVNDNFPAIHSSQLG